jgi:PIN domain nuclease of toxin-antitoxin system
LIVLDSWALLAYLKDEAQASRVEEAWLSQGAAISSINLGEARYMRIRERGEGAAAADIEKIRKRSKLVGADWALIRSAARVKAKGGLSYADAFCVATALRLEAPLWTGDSEIVEIAEDLRCEVVDLRVPSG